MNTTESTGTSEDGDEFGVITSLMMIGFIMGPCLAGFVHFCLVRHCQVRKWNEGFENNGPTQSYSQFRTRNHRPVIKLERYF